MKKQSAVYEGRGRRSLIGRGISARVKPHVPSGWREAIVLNSNSEDGKEQIRRLEDDGYEVMPMPETSKSNGLPGHATVMIVPDEVWNDNKALAEAEARERVLAKVDFAQQGVYDPSIRVTKDEMKESAPLRLTQLASELS